MSTLKELAAMRPKVPFSTTRNAIQQEMEIFKTTKDLAEAKMSLEKIGELIAGMSSIEEADKVRLALLKQRPDLKRVVKVGPNMIDPRTSKPSAFGTRKAGLRFDFTDQTLEQQYIQLQQKQQEERMKSIMGPEPTTITGSLKNMIQGGR